MKNSIQNDFELFADEILSRITRDADGVDQHEQTQTRADQNQEAFNLTKLDHPIELPYLDNSPGDTLEKMLENTTNRKLSPRENSYVEDKLEECGIDFLAYYKSYRRKEFLPHKGYWGIFAYDWALSKIGIEISQYLKKADPSYYEAWKVIHCHEVFHFLTDYWTLSREAELGKELYPNYSRKIYQKYYPNEVVVEESLANNFVWNWCRIHRPGNKKIGGWVEKFMDKQPGAYANFRQDPVQMNRVLASQILNSDKWEEGMEEQSKSPWMLPISEESLWRYRSEDPVDSKLCPCWLIRNSSVLSL